MASVRNQSCLHMQYCLIIKLEYVGIPEGLASSFRSQQPTLLKHAGVVNSTSPNISLN